MKKPVIITIVVVVILALIAGVYFALTDSSDLKKLEKEVETFTEKGITNVELVTKGELSKVEAMLKSDFKQAEKISKKLEEESIEELLKAENLTKDVENFVETKLQLNTIKESIDEDIAVLKKILTEEQQNIRAEEEKLSKEVKEKYKELLKKSKLEDVLKDLEKERDLLGQKLQKAEEYLNHLINFKDKWKFVEGKFEALEEAFKNECEKIYDEMKKIGKKG